MNRPGRILIVGSPGFIRRPVIRAAKEVWPDTSLYGLGRTNGREPCLTAYLSVEVRAENVEEIRGYVECDKPDAVVTCLGFVPADCEAASCGEGFRVWFSGCSIPSDHAWTR